MTDTTTNTNQNHRTSLVSLYNPDDCVLLHVGAAGGTVRGLRGRVYPVLTVTFEVPTEWVTAAQKHDLDLVVPVPNDDREIHIMNENGITTGIEHTNDCHLPLGRRPQPLYIHFPDPTPEAASLLMRIGGYRVRRYIHKQDHQPVEVWQLSAATIRHTGLIRLDDNYLGVTAGRTSIVPRHQSVCWGFTLYDAAEVVIGSAATARRLADCGLAMWPIRRSFYTWEELRLHIDEITGLRVVADDNPPPFDILAKLAAVTIKHNSHLIQLMPNAAM